MLLSTAILAGLGLASGLGLAVAARLFAVKTDPRQEEVLDALPGANCGGCGYAGCADFSAAVVRGEAKPDGCPVNDAAGSALVAKIMGLVVEEKERQVALVLCQGTFERSPMRYEYNGMTSCASAALLGGGPKSCTYGCLGFADCQEACAFEAIEMTEGGIARVIPDRCTACGMCVIACPKDLIQMVPESSAVHVLCRNRDKGGPAKKACSVACIGCQKCVKTAGEDEMSMDGFLAEVNYKNAPTDPAIAEVCPTGAIQILAMKKAESLKVN